MATVETHYKDVLSDVYSWMLGGFDLQLARNRSFFEKLRIRPDISRNAIDLGAGCGFQSIPLAELGYSVTAIDLDEQLLQELKANDPTATVKVIRDDMLAFADHITAAPELVVCMTDTLLHLETAARVRQLIDEVFAHLEVCGQFVLTFRDLSRPLENLDRFIPVKQDDDTVFTCFLEYEPNFVKVHDLVYIRSDAGWKLNKSFYRKLRLSPDWVRNQLVAAGFSDVRVDIEQGLASIVAAKSTGTDGD